VSREPGTLSRCLDADLQNSDRERRRESELSANSERVSANSEQRTAAAAATYGPLVCPRAHNRGTAERAGMTPPHLPRPSSLACFRDSDCISRTPPSITAMSCNVQRADGLRDDTNAILALEGRATRTSRFRGAQLPAASPKFQPQLAARHAVVCVGDACMSCVKGPGPRRQAAIAVRGAWALLGGNPARSQLTLHWPCWHTRLHERWGAATKDAAQAGPKIDQRAARPPQPGAGPPGPSLGLQHEGDNA
jgi:hypothetical protein